jgi:NAD(P)-dependent dehydrogenase (short-subunit alcohol dehydrogenase family)
MGSLAGKVAIVTGAASGIGRACAARFAQAGAKVVIADIDEAAAREAARTIDGAVAIAADVSREEQVRSLIAAASEHHGPIDLFYSNAGIAGPGGGPETDDDAGIQRTWDVNVMAHLWAARALLPGMTERGDGYLVSTASAAGLLTQLSGLAYTITKHAAVALAEWLSITYAHEGIKVSCVCPEAVNTPLLAEAVDADPVGSAPMLADPVIEPEDAAATVLEGIEQERFLILPHPQVQTYIAFKGAQPERWLGAMRQVLDDSRRAAGQ